jgi:zinc finger-containing ubiquitin peptidase 1
MPTWLRNQLEGGRVTTRDKTMADSSSKREVFISNETWDIVPLLAQLCELDKSIEQAFLCHPGVKHIMKLPGEGVFTGYQNIQMLISYIQAAHSEGFQHFQGGLPTVLRLQDLIEEAWDKGINGYGRIETGGIKGTRKYIGTPEVRGPVKFAEYQY